MAERRSPATILPRLPRLTLISLALLGACQLHSDHAPQAADPAPAGSARAVLPPPVDPVVAPRSTIVTLTPAIPSAAVALDARLRRLGEGFRGEVGLAVRDVQTGWTSHYNGLDYFPQQSVSKLWVAVSLLDRVDRGALGLGDRVTVSADDLTLFHQPIRPLALKPGGFRTTNEDLLVRALTQSDNTANDRLLREVGGPDAVRDTLARKGLMGIRFGPGERPLQSGIAGLEWKPAYAQGGGFYAARDTLPDAVRRAAFDGYVADPVDGATPFGIVDALARLKTGQLLSTGATEQMMDIMSHTRTGPQRLKGGLPPGWTLSHKTGTGQVFQGEQAGYNDVGILTAPDGRAYSVAVLIGRTARPLPERMALMQAVVRATVAYDAALATQREAAAAD
ncbi:serine hydrolase [Sphingomonas quercus]|uniref:beta-lactamase n=1 Tax=Sphingomonas quercus TaxID=2842451 RepID=A0ABS6BGP3_9SPHN|nr:serine hydrolase [Sphingomonas quercus]MBU3077459.1 class A beta-lactamase-related serine hydrolase [Sphingomonas quercus]